MPSRHKVLLYCNLMDVRLDSESTWTWFEPSSCPWKIKLTQGVDRPGSRRACFSPVCRPGAVSLLPCSPINSSTSHFSTFSFSPASHKPQWIFNSMNPRTFPPIPWHPLVAVSVNQKEMSSNHLHPSLASSFTAAITSLLTQTHNPKPLQTNDQIDPTPPLNRPPQTEKLTYRFCSRPLFYWRFMPDQLRVCSVMQYQNLQHVVYNRITDATTLSSPAPWRTQYHTFKLGLGHATLIHFAFARKLPPPGSPIGALWPPMEARSGRLKTPQTQQATRWRVRSRGWNRKRVPREISLVLHPRENILRGWRCSVWFTGRGEERFSHGTGGKGLGVCCFGGIVWKRGFSGWWCRGEADWGGEWAEGVVQRAVRVYQGEEVWADPGAPGLARLWDVR